MAGGVPHQENIYQQGIQNPPDTFTRTLGAGDIATINYACDYVRIMSYTGALGDLGIRFASTANFAEGFEAGLGFDLAHPVDRVEIKNLGSTPFTITLALAFGIINDDRLTVSGTIVTKPKSADDIKTTQTTVSTSAVRLVTGASTNTNVLVSAGASDLYIGKTSGVTAANGFLVPSGTTLSLDTVTDLYGIRGSGSDTAYTLLSEVS